MMIINPSQTIDVPADGQQAAQLVQQLLSVMRSHTGMEVAFLSHVADGRRRFEYVDADPWFCPIEPGESDELSGTYCGRVLDGRVPELILDAAREPGVADLDVTRELPIGSHLSVPVLTSTGEVFGTLCCFSRQVRPDLQERDVRSLRLFAEVISRHLDGLYEQERSAAAIRTRVSHILDAGGPAMALQPIMDLASGDIDGYEALARFPDALGATPDRWFAAADRVGLGTALESSAVQAAMRLLARLPDRVSLGINVSAPALLARDGIVEMFLRPEAPRLVLELTEHHDICDHDALWAALARVRERGVRIAIDDAGSGYAGLERILRLAPEILKLDRALVNGIAEHPGRQAMCEAMVGFTRRMGATLVAEGVETDADLCKLRALGVHHAQGYLLGRPQLWPR